jgi:hypothetical protein
MVFADIVLAGNEIGQHYPDAFTSSQKIGQLRAFASSVKLRQRLAGAQYALFTTTVQIHILA